MKRIVYSAKKKRNLTIAGASLVGIGSAAVITGSITIGIFNSIRISTQSNFFTSFASAVKEINTICATNPAFKAAVLQLCIDNLVVDNFVDVITVNTGNNLLDFATNNINNISVFNYDVKAILYAIIAASDGANDSDIQILNTQFRSLNIGKKSDFFSNIGSFFSKLSGFVSISSELKSDSSNIVLLTSSYITLPQASLLLIFLGSVPLLTGIVPLLLGVTSKSKDKVN